MTANEDDNGKVIIRTLLGYTEIPSDLPLDTEEIAITGMTIKTLRDNSFHNMVHLYRINLKCNEISHVEAGTFAGLPALARLYLADNDLVTISWNIFGPDNNLGEIFKETFRIGLYGNPFQCGQSMCWIKEGQQEGWLGFWGLEPQCLNHRTEKWIDIDVCNLVGKFSCSGKIGVS